MYTRLKYNSADYLVEMKGSLIH